MQFGSSSSRPLGRSFVGSPGVGNERFTSTEGTLGNWSTNSPDEWDWSGDEDGHFPVSRLRQQYIDYLAAKVQEYEEAKQSRHYYHGAQYTPDEIRTLRARRQPVITFNRTNRKIDQIIGLLQRIRQEPKGYPRHPKDGPGAQVATNCIREVLEANDWKFLDPYCAGQAATEGIGGIEFKLIPGDKGDPDIGMDFIFGDDFFYDPRSFKPDFSDARYMGIAKWMDVEAAVELFPEQEEQIRSLMVESGFDLTTHADREFKWIYVNEKRLRLVEHWYKHRGKWHWAFYCSSILLDQGVSPFLDERKRPMNRFVMFSAAVDHDGDRYGFVRNFKGPQDEINQRRSKALFISNTTRIIAQKGAVDDVETARREMARPDGWVEINQGFELPQEKQKQEDLQAHLALMQDARQEIDSFANIRPDALPGTGGDDTGDHSGVAINMLQKAGIAELGSFLRNYRSWKIRVYRAIWNAVQNTWQGERWIRVSGQPNMFGVPIEGGQQGGPQSFLMPVNQMRMGPMGQPQVVNAVGALDINIILDDGPDNANVMQDAYEVLKGDPNVPWQIKLMFMPLPEEMRTQVQQAMQQQQQPDPKVQAEQLKLQGQQMKNQAEQGKAQMQARTSMLAYQKDRESDQRAQQLELTRAGLEREAMQYELVQAREEHALKMRELLAQHQAKMEELAEQQKLRAEQRAHQRRQMSQRPTKRAA